MHAGMVDRGSGVREKTKQIIELLQNNESIRYEREKAKSLRNKFIGIEAPTSGGDHGYGSGGHDNSNTGRYGGYVCAEGGSEGEIGRGSELGRRSELGREGGRGRE